MRSLMKMIGVSSLILDKKLRSNENGIFQEERNEYGNLNMANMAKKDFYHHTSFFENNSSFYGIKKFQDNFVLRDNPFFLPRAKNNVDSNSFFALNANIAQESDKHFVKEDKITSANRSTLSLHIEAYENSGGEDNKNVIKKENVSSKTFKEVKDIFKGLKLNDENVFEFPRQNEDKQSDPEITQYRSSQRLLDPSKAHISLAQAVKIFQSPPGAQRINWRTEILKASGYPQYIVQSDKILGKLDSLKNKTEKTRKHHKKGAWDDVFLEVGELEKWENKFKPEFGPNIEQSKQIELLTEAYKEGQKRETANNNERETLSLELQKSTKMNADFLTEIKMHERRESQLMDTIKDLQSREDEKDAEHGKIIKKLEETIVKLRKLNKDKSNKLNYKGFTSAAGPSQKLKPDEPVSKKAKIMENGREYSMEFVMLCVQLSWNGIKDLKIPQVIRLITSYFDVEIERFPDQSTVTRWCNEQVVFIDQHIYEFFENAENLTVHSDETTLSGDKLQAYIICKNVNGVRTYMVVGIEQVPDKSAARSLTAFLECMKRSIDVFRDLDNEVVINPFRFIVNMLIS